MKCGEEIELGIAVKEERGGHRQTAGNERLRMNQTGTSEPLRDPFGIEEGQRDSALGEEDNGYEL